MSLTMYSSDLVGVPPESMTAVVRRDAGEFASRDDGVTEATRGSGRMSRLLPVERC
ncbi:hypothetical protein J4H85_05510 [Leucobacter tardus]|uniref:Uncharacterized protein n=1 Tax=Leucobacter tardus TaxID=501483 RepID=A0A939QK89_9MICO|nr:hypothetical protein [Leucobacter tardus]MBO2989451.1 hypothetical protein [Leucobacter tardus]